MQIESSSRRTALYIGLSASGVLVAGLCPLPAKAAHALLLPWVGSYSGHSGLLQLRRDGRLAWRWSVFARGGDAGIEVTASGAAQFLDGWMLVTLDPGSIKSASGPAPSGDVAATLPSRLYLVRIGRRRLLVDDGTITMAINEANGWGRHSLDVQHALQLRDAAYEATRSVPVPIVALVPPAQQRFLHATPLTGKVVAIRDLVPASGDRGSAATLDLDIGAEHGVFVGMSLYLGPRQSRGSMEVSRVDARSCSGRLIWFTDGPRVGTPVSTAYAS